MPNVSQAQRAAMFAALKGKSALGIPKSVALEFTATDPGGKLPPHISEHRRSLALANALKKGKS